MIDGDDWPLPQEETSVMLSEAGIQGDPSAWHVLSLEPHED